MRRIILLEAPTEVRPPEGIIYSTRPKKALAEDGVQYYLKGPDQSVVAAEAIAYELANLVGLTVSAHGLCEVRGVGVFFASKEVRTRSGLEAVLSDGLAINLDLCDTPLFPSPRNLQVPLSDNRLKEWLHKAQHLARLLRLEHDAFHGLRRKWATERKHLPDVDVANAGGGRSVNTMKRSYQQADDAGSFGSDSGAEEAS